MGGKLVLTAEDKAWALKIKERDGFKCIVCGSTQYLNSHHLFPRERKDTKYDLLNGVCLCVKHHMFSRVISAHNNPIEFFLWLMDNRPEQWDFITRRSTQ